MCACVRVCVCVGCVCWVCKCVCVCLCVWVSVFAGACGSLYVYAYGLLKYFALQLGYFIDDIREWEGKTLMFGRKLAKEFLNKD